MIDLSEDPEAQVLAFVKTWLSLIASDNWDAALSSLDDLNSDGVCWTKERITSLIDETFGPDTHFASEFGRPRLSEPSTAKGTPHYAFGKLERGGFWLDHDLPLNGTFSDLTVQFVFPPRGEKYGVSLVDLHVL